MAATDTEKAATGAPPAEAGGNSGGSNGSGNGSGGGGSGDGSGGQQRAQAREREAVREAIRRTASFDFTFALMNALATVVACYGLLADSTATVIGAMIIAMLLGPISGIALALVDGDGVLLRRALTAEVGGAALVLGVAFSIGTIHRDMPLTDELLARTRPTVLDLVIALAGGAAGAYAAISPRVSVGLVGVAIATALVPPLSTCGILLARGQERLALGGFLLFFANLVAIQFASSAVMWLSGFRGMRTALFGARKNRRRWMLHNAVSVVLLVTLAVLLTLNFQRALRVRTYERAVRRYLQGELERRPGVTLSDVQIVRQPDGTRIRASVFTPFSLPPREVVALEAGLAALPGSAGVDVELSVRSVLIKETNRRGYLHEEASSEAGGAAAPADGAAPDTLLSTPRTETYPAGANLDR